MKRDGKRCLCCSRKCAPNSEYCWSHGHSKAPSQYEQELMDKVEPQRLHPLAAERIIDGWMREG